MDRLISENSVIEVLKSHMPTVSETILREMISTVPTEYAPPSPSAHWEPMSKNSGVTLCSCSHCGYVETHSLTNYCGGCGSKMEEEDKEPEVFGTWIQRAYNSAWYFCSNCGELETESVDTGELPLVCKKCGAGMLTKKTAG